MRILTSFLRSAGTARRRGSLVQPGCSGASSLPSEWSRNPLPGERPVTLRSLPIDRCRSGWPRVGTGKSAGRLHRGHTQGRAGGLILEAANGRDLYWINHSAPRLVRPVTGDFIVETICATAYDDRPAMGGLLLWRDPDHYLLLDWGRGGPGELLLEGCLDGVDHVWGRGYLPAPQITLRLARRGERVDTFCSADGRRGGTSATRPSRPTTRYRSACAPSA